MFVILIIKILYFVIFNYIVVYFDLALESLLGVRVKVEVRGSVESVVLIIVVRFSLFIYF